MVDTGLPPSITMTANQHRHDFQLRTAYIAYSSIPHYSWSALQKDSIQVPQHLDGDISQPQTDGHRTGVIRESPAVEDAETWLWAGSSLIPSVLSSQPL